MLNVRTSTSAALSSTRALHALPRLVPRAFLLLLVLPVVPVAANAPRGSLIVRPRRRRRLLLCHRARQLPGLLLCDGRSRDCPSAGAAPRPPGPNLRDHVGVVLSLHDLLSPSSGALAVHVERETSRAERPDGDPPERQHHVCERD